jgi:ligand-binding sensor domain-containing protein/signal transduction histidine kinase
VIKNYLRVGVGLLLAASCVRTCAKAAGGPLVRLPVVDKTDIHFAHISFGNGPSHSRVAQIVQDDQGFLWFGTQDGLQRFDGYKFRPIRPDLKDANGISGVFINSLFKDSSGMLWVGSDDYLNRYDPTTDRFTHFRSHHRDSSGIEGEVLGITQDREGNLWFATNHGLTRLEPATGHTVRYQHNPSDRASLSADRVRSTFEDKEGRFWVGTMEGIDLFNRRTGKVLLHSPLKVGSNSVISVFEDHASVLWVTFTSGNGLASLDPVTGALTQYSFHKRDPPSGLLAGVNAIIEDEDGALWLGTQGSGLLKFDKDRKMFARYCNDPSDFDSPSEDNIFSLLEDREGNIWVGTSGGGINRFSRKPPPFENYRHRPGNPNSLSSNFVASVYPNGRGDLWVGTRGALNRLDRRSGHFQFYQTAGSGPHDISNTNVVSIVEDRSHYLWFGTWGGGLNRFDRGTGQFTVYRHDPADAHSLSDDSVGSLFVDRKGTLWAGTDDGLDRFDPERQHFQIYRAAGGLSRYHAIAEDADGALWLASWEAGLQRFDPVSGQFSNYKHVANNAQSLSSDHVNSICIDSQGTLWVGTQSGLDRFDRATHTFIVYDERSGLPNNTVVSILADSRGSLWLGTNNGLSRFDPRTNIFRNYYASDGLPANEFNSFGTAYKSSNGEMFFCTYGGLLTFRPEQVVDNLFVPPVVLADFRLFGVPARPGEGSPLKKPIDVTSSITLSHEQNIFSLEFAALSFASPERNRYRYRLENLETHWNETDSTRRFASYTTLHPGDYVFRVQGSNNRGVWNDTGASVRIRILPAAWNTWWFRAVAVTVLLMCLGSAYYFRIQSIAQEFNVRLEERIGERMRIARELHDTLLQSFQGALFEFQAARNLFSRQPGEALRTLDGAIGSAEQAIVEGRDAIQGLRPGVAIETNLEHLLTMAGQALGRSQQNNGSRPDFGVTVEGAPQTVSPVVQDEVYRICRELIRNAFQHAHASRIEAELRYNGGSLRVRIRDNGKGIDRTVLAQGGVRPGHFGLPGVRERAKRVGARLVFWSETGAGTEVELTVPARVAYAKFHVQGRLRLFRKRSEVS